MLCLGAFIADIVPRTLWRSRGQLRQFKDEAHAADPRALDPGAHHPGRARADLLLRHLRQLPEPEELPAVRPCAARPRQGDFELHKFDQWLLFGHDPALILHNLLGTTFSAHVLSYVYLIFLPMVPITVTIWLVWSRNVSFGYWYVTAQCICWTLGTASYYMIPTLGPNFAFPWLYEDLAQTGVTQLQDALYWGRYNVRFDPLAERRPVGGRVRLAARRRHAADGAGRRSTPCGTGSSRSCCGPTWSWW